jgi:hypothetical protein
VVRPGAISLNVFNDEKKRKEDKRKEKYVLATIAAECVREKSQKTHSLQKYASAFCVYSEVM